ncbi:MAG: M28 family peptidase [Cyclobacteriaceae bacterium]
MISFSINRSVGIVCVVLLWTAVVQAQPKATPKTYGNQVSAENLKKYLSVIAADSMEGRATGSRGQAMAGDYIKSHFRRIGLEPISPDFYQKVPLFAMAPGRSTLSTSDSHFSNFKDFAFLGIGPAKQDRVALIYVANDNVSLADDLNIDGKAVLIVSNKRSNELPVQNLLDRGATLVMLCISRDDEAFLQYAGRIQSHLESSRPSLNKPEATSEFESLVFVSPSFVEKLFKTPFDKLKSLASRSELEKIKPSQISYELRNEIKEIETGNVLGFLEGTDRKDEVIVVTAHYDHIGMLDVGNGDRINNGADDDGSGTVAVMELARVFAKAKKEGNGPRRSILFMTVTGEEIGLFGSYYYTENPIIPLTQTMVNLNIDMIGRIDEAHRQTPEYVYVIGADKLSKELNTVSEKTNQQYTNLIFDYTYNDVGHPSNLYKRSDHWNFAKNDIPIIFYFDGIHQDYHRPSDEVDLIEFPLLEKRVRLVFYTTWELANRDKKITAD